MDLEMNFTLSFFFLALIPMAIAAFLTHFKGYESRSKKKLPPGEMGIPWIGETIDFYKAQKKNKLFEEFVQPRIHKYGKTFKTRIMGSPTVLVNGAEANKFFLSNEFKLVVSSWPSSSVQLMGKNSIMEKQGEAHRFIRGIVASSLGCLGLEAMVPKICKTVQMHLHNNWQGKQIISLFHLTKMLTLNIVFECLLGIDVKPGLLDTFERVLEGVFAPPIAFPGSKFSKAKGARLEIEKMLINVVRKKKEEIDVRGEKEEETLLSRLVTAMINGEISEEEVVDNIVLLVFAAHDTTTFAIAMTFRMLAQHPNSYSLLLQEHESIVSNKRPGDELLSLEDTKNMKYTWQVARESMRLFPPIFGSFRKATADIEYEGFTIPRGWKVLWTTYGTHYDAEHFQDPLKFDPSRFEEPIQVQPYAYIPFGGGPRLCAGYQLAKLNILIFVHYVVTQYNWSLINPDEPITMDPLPFPSQGMNIKISPKLK